MSETFFESVMPSMVLYEIGKGSDVYMLDRQYDGGTVYKINSFNARKLTEMLELAKYDTQNRFDFWKCIGGEAG